MAAIPLAAMAAVALAATLAAVPSSSDAMALTVTAPPDCLVELKTPLTTWVDANCGTATVDPPGTPVISSVTGTATLPKGTTIVTWTATASGVTAYDWQAVVVADTALPTITVPDAPIVESTVPVPPPPTLVTAQDGTVVCGDATLRIHAATRTECSASDPEGNKIGVTIINAIKDTTPPTITPPGAVTVEATAPKMELSKSHGKATATDLVDTDVDVSAVLADGLRVGDNTITWVATDYFGNSASAEQTITVTDTTAPSITAPPDIDVYTRTATTTSADTLSTRNLGIPTATDIADPRVRLSVNLPYFLSIGKATTTWTATDDSGNTATDTQTITVKRGPPPPMGTTAVDAKVLRTLSPSPASTYTGDLLYAVTDHLLLVSGQSRHMHLYNATTGELVKRYTSPPDGSFHYAVPIKSDEDDSHFAAECYNCSPARILIYNHTESGPVKTITAPAAPQIPAPLEFVPMASLGDRLYVHASHTPDSAYYLEGHIYIYNTTTWQQIGEIPNPTPTRLDDFGFFMGYRDYEDDSKEKLFVTSMFSQTYDSSRGLYDPDIQAFSASDNSLLDTVRPPLEGTVSEVGPYGIVEADGGFIANSLFSPTGGSYIENILHYRPGQPLKYIESPPCCHHTEEHPIEYANGKIYSATTSSDKIRRIHVYDATTGAEIGYHGTNPPWSTTGGNSGYKAMEHIKDNIFAVAEWDLPPYNKGVQIIQLGTPTSTTSGAGDRAQYASEGVPRVQPKILYSEHLGDNTIRITYDAVLDPHHVSTGDYALTSDDHTIVSTTVDQHSVIIKYVAAQGTVDPAIVPGVHMIRNVDYWDMRGLTEPPATPPPAPATPPPAPASIEFTTGGLDGATVALGESRTFNVEVTRVEGGGFAIVLLSDQPGFVTVQNTGLNRATITVNTAHESATVGQHTFTVMAAVGSNPVTKSVTVNISQSA